MRAQPVPAESARNDRAPNSTSAAPAASATRPGAERPRKLSFKEQRELQELPLRIQALEAEQTRLNADMNDPEFFRRDPSAMRAAPARLEAIETELLELLEKWEALEQRAREVGR
jgi:ATP-binding cassette subfamily F protein uup